MFSIIMFIFNDTTSRIYLAQHINRSEKLLRVFFEKSEFQLDYKI